MGRIGRLLTVAAVLAIAHVALAGGASAHTSLTSSEPRTGEVVEGLDRIVLRFDEPVALTAIHAWLENDDGVIPLAGPGYVDGDARVVLFSVPPVASGIYSIGYHVVASDGDAAVGEVKFTFDRPAAAGEPAEPIAPPVTGVKPLPSQRASAAPAASQSSGTPVVLEILLLALIGAVALLIGRRAPLLLLRRPS